jgi:hypothetical protein
LSRVKNAMDQGENLLSERGVDFVQTSCCILGINSEEKIDSIGKQALADGTGNVRKTMSVITRLLDSLGGEAKKIQERNARPVPDHLGLR